MTIEETFRRIVRGHLMIIVLCTLLPLSVVIGIQVGKPKEWLASARIQVIAGAPKSTTEADGLNSRVLALATTPSLLEAALGEAGAVRDLNEFATKHVTAERLGESSVVQLSVTDNDSAAAARIVSALAQQVADFLNKGDRARFNAALAALDQQIATATKYRRQLAGELRKASDLNKRGNVQADIASADLALTQLSNQRAGLVLADATRDEAVVVGDQADVRLVPSAVIPQSALALLLGLIVGLTFAAGLETLRPKVASTRALARMLQTPVLGSAGQPVASLANAMALAARRQGVDSIVLLGIEPRDSETVSGLLTRLSPEERAADRRNHAEVAPTAQAAAAALSAAADDGLDEAAMLPFANVRFTELSAITPEDEMTAGVVVVSTGTVLHRRLDDLDDVLKAVRWPVLGVLDASGRRALGASR
jgi:capsular polysaccharide biosynthesis protein